MPPKNQNQNYVASSSGVQFVQVTDPTKNSSSHYYVHPGKNPPIPLESFPELEELSHMGEMEEACADFHEKVEVLGWISGSKSI